MIPFGSVAPVADVHVVQIIMATRFSSLCSHAAMDVGDHRHCEPTWSAKLKTMHLARLHALGLEV
jgi:hypothetical protein